MHDIGSNKAKNYQQQTYCLHKQKQCKIQAKVSVGTSEGTNGYLPARNTIVQI